MKLIALVTLIPTSFSIPLFIFGQEDTKDYVELEKSHNETLPASFSVCASFYIVTLTGMGRYLIKLLDDNGDTWLGINY